MSGHLTLVSHALCPYVQRAAIVLVEKGAAFERRYVDLSAKPAWFNAISPLGKTPVLLADDTPIFESAAICEYLDETREPKLHPHDTLRRAQHRGWMEFASALLNTIWTFYTAPDEALLQAKARQIRGHFEQIEAALGGGPFFDGERFCIVDAAFAPVFRYFDVFDRIGDFGCLMGLPKVSAWRKQLAMRPSVHAAVSSGYPAELLAFLRTRRSALAARIEARELSS